MSYHFAFTFELQIVAIKKNRGICLISESIFEDFRSDEILCEDIRHIVLYVLLVETREAPT